MLVKSQAALDALVDGFPANARRVLAKAGRLFAPLEAAGDSKRAGNCLLLQAYAHYHLEDDPKAKAFLTAWEPWVKEKGWTDVGLKLLNLEGLLAKKLGDYPAAIAAFRDGLSQATALSTRGTFCLNLGHVYHALGDYAAALDLYEQSLRLWRKTSHRREEIPVHYSLGDTLRAAGQPTAALRHYRDAYSLAEVDDDAERMTLVFLAMASAHEELGDSREEALALELAQQMASNVESRTVPPPSLRRRVQVKRALFELKRGDAEVGARALREILAVVKPPEELDVIEAFLALANAPSTSPVEAADLFRRVLDLVSPRHMKVQEAEAHLGLARLAEAEGDWKALHHYQRARELERAVYNEETSRRLQSIELHKETDELRRDLDTERRESAEIRCLLAEVEKQKGIAEEASRQKSAILGIAAHDLGNSLSTILLGLEALDTPDIPVEDWAHHREDVGDLRSSAFELRGLLRRLLDFAAVENGDISSLPENMELTISLQKLVEEWQPMAEAKKQRLVADFPTKWVEVFMDPARFHQIVGNFLSNAIKYGPPEAAIDLRLVAVPAGWRVEVHDRGPGLTAEDEQKLFRPFQRLSARPTGDESSTGLGLHITRLLAENEGGSVGYTPRPDGGSIFWFQLPDSRDKKGS